MRVHGYMITINNFDDDDIANCMSLFYDYNARYIIIAFEVGKKCSTPHIQGYVYFDNARTRQSLSKMLMSRACIFAARATGDKSYRRADYCRKDGDFYEEGIEPSPGKIGREYLDDVMKDPYSHLQAYSQYRRIHQSLRNLEKPNKKIVYELKSESDIPYDKLDPDDTFIAKLNDDFKTYEGQSILVVANTNNTFSLHRWQLGFPSTTIRGYEIVKINPSIVYLVDTNK